MKKIDNVQRTALFKVCSKKTLRIMKLTVFFLLVTIFNVFGSKTYSQNARLNLDMKDVPIQTVLNAIEGQSEFFFLYSSKMIDVNQKVDINVADKKITEVLDELLANTEIKYAVRDRQILLVNEEAEASLALQQKRVTGTVVDKDQQPVPGANVVVKGTRIGAITEADGKFTLDVPASGGTLVISFIGYTSQEVEIGNNTVVNVTLQTESLSLDEVVVVGYGTQKKATLTGAIDDLRGEKLVQSPSLNVSNILAGRIPGLVAVTRSGEPGLDNTTLRIRGTNTLNNNSPLIVVNGIANRNFNLLNAADIESITVLKDASAAIYGSQSANGVILVTTKRGSVEKSKVNINLDRGWSKPTIIPEMADAATYADVLNELSARIGGAPVYTKEEIQKYRDGSDPWLYPNNNWADIVLKNFTPQYHLYASATGGTEKMAYFISAGYKFQDAIYKNSSTNFSLADFRSNLDGKISDNIKISFDVAGKQSIANQPNELKERVLVFLFRGKPNWPVVWPNGLPGPAMEMGQNPVVITTQKSGYIKTTTYNLESNLKLDISIPWIKGLSITGNAAFDKTFVEGRTWDIPWTLYNWDRKTYDDKGIPILVPGSYAAWGHGTDPDLTVENTFGANMTLNALVNYKRTIFKLHNINVLLGTERSTGKSNYLSAYRRYFVSSAIDEMFAGGDLLKDNTGSSSESARQNFFGRLNYDYSGKYLAEFVFRYDGSYIFPEKGRYGFFPGVSLGWNIAEENFWKNNIPFINYFKLRGSWGKTGNDRINPFQYLTSYGFVNQHYMGNVTIFGENLEYKTLGELRIPNPNVTWEEANQLDVGFDGKIFKGKLNFSFDYFYNLRTKILAYRNASVPGSTGLTLPNENIGEVVNRGFEAEIGYIGPSDGDFIYSVSVNCGYQKNYIKFWDETPGIPEYQQSTGKQISTALRYEAIGIFKDQAAVDAYPHWKDAKPGDIIYKDVNDDKVIDGKDLVRQEKTSIPTFNAGMSIDLAYRNVYAAILLQGAAGATRTFSHRVGFAGNYRMSDINGRWTADNPNATKPAIWDEGTYYNSDNTYWERNNDYLRLKNIEIGYNLNTIKGIDGIRIYFSGVNLLTLTKMTDYDPESTGEWNYPQNKLFNFGLSLTF